MSRPWKLWPLASFCSCLSWLMPLVATAEQPVTFKDVGDGLAVMIGDAEFTVLRQDNKLPKPFFSPVRAPDGAIITRPIDDPTDKDHPHHKGIWLAVDEVNEIKFWAERGQDCQQEHCVSARQPGDSQADQSLARRGRPASSHRDFHRVFFFFAPDRLRHHADACRR